MSSPGESATQGPTPEVCIDLLRAEYFKLQDIIEAFDQRALQIKGWSVTVSLAGMATAVVADIPAQDKALAFFIAACASSAFWMIEFFWKCFQWTFFHRIDAIEAAFAGPNPAAERPLQIRKVFHARFKKELLTNAPKAFKPSLMFPHVLIAAMGFTLAARYQGWQP
ncbi:MAG TPA: hypothetical protein VEZ20_16005 [Allosphingosinicella sp.]|jgi:hypothetical protein|nr:hypothetical protein [Allosphingosinicella sp.]